MMLNVDTIEVVWVFYCELGKIDLHIITAMPA